MGLDRIALADVVIHRSPDVRAWPITVDIVGAKCSAAGGFELAFSRPLPDAWKWASNPANPSDNFQYTVWLFLKMSGTWHGAGFVQMWQGRAMGTRALPPIFADVDGVPGFRNWWGDVRRLWDEMSDYVPAPGDQIMLMISAGNARLVGGISSEAERSNIVPFTLRADDSGQMVYLDDAPSPTPGPVQPPPAAGDIGARLTAIELALADLRQLVLLLSAPPPPHYQGSVVVPYLGTGKITLEPIVK